MKGIITCNSVIIVCKIAQSRMWRIHKLLHSDEKIRKIMQLLGDTYFQILQSFFMKLKWGNKIPLVNVVAFLTNQRMNETITDDSIVTEYETSYGIKLFSSFDCTVRMLISAAVRGLSLGISATTYILWL